MNETFISPLYDFAFAEIFGNQKKINNTVGFLKTLLDIPEEEYGLLKVESSFLRKVVRTGKTGIVDLKLSTKSGKIIHIELQVDKKKDMKDRILYYMCRLIGDQLKWGDGYDKLHQVISIVICNHNMLKEESSYINEYELRNKDNRVFTEKLKLVILELQKLPEIEDAAVWRYLRLFKCKSKEELNMLAKLYPDLEDLVCSIRNMGLIGMLRDIHFHKGLQKADEKAREAYIIEEAQKQGLEQGLKQGIEQGFAKGRKERDQYFFELLDQGLTVDEIKQKLLNT